MVISVKNILVTNVTKNIYTYIGKTKKFKKYISYICKQKKLVTTVILVNVLEQLGYRQKVDGDSLVQIGDKLFIKTKLVMYLVINNKITKLHKEESC